MLSIHPYSTSTQSYKGTAAVQTPPTMTSIFYINDVHGQTGKMESLATAAQSFDSFVKKNPKIDSLKLAAGDVLIGEDPKINQAATAFLNFIGLNATTLGNHEFDIFASRLSDIVKNVKYKIVGANINFHKDMPLKDKVINSYVQEVNGQKYGIIGLQPLDLVEAMRLPDCVDGISVDTPNKTLVQIQDEVHNLKLQGVNKIIVLSHTGHDFEKQIAQKVSGVDVIIGGHTHELLDSVVPGKNLFYSPEGEPVILTQAGKDGNHFGVLNLEFDSNGKIVRVQNNIGNTKNYARNLTMQAINNTILGGSEVVGELKAAQEPPDNLACENPYADFTTDAMRAELDTDIALVQGGNMRGGAIPGKVTARDLLNITPFRNRMVKYELGEDKLVEALRWGAESINTPEGKPGYLQVSGLNYTVTKSGKLVDATFIDKKGKRHKINILNPDKTKKYTVALDDFCATNVLYPSLRQPRERFLAYYEFDKDKLMVDYVKKMNGKPFEIKTDGRIKIIDG